MEGPPRPWRTPATVQRMRVADETTFSSHCAVKCQRFDHIGSFDEQELVRGTDTPLPSCIRAEMQELHLKCAICRCLRMARVQLVESSSQDWNGVRDA